MHFRSMAKENSKMNQSSEYSWFGNCDYEFYLKYFRVIHSVLMTGVFRVFSFIIIIVYLAHLLLSHDLFESRTIRWITDRRWRWMLRFIFTFSFGRSGSSALLFSILIHASSYKLWAIYRMGGNERSIYAILRYKIFTMFDLYQRFDVSTWSLFLNMECMTNGVKVKWP